MNRDQMLAWAKGRALAYLTGADPQPRTAVQSFMSDIRKGGEYTRDIYDHPLFLPICMSSMGSVADARCCIEGFN